MFPLLQIQLLENGFIVQYNEPDQDKNEVKDRAMFCKDTLAIHKAVDEALKGVDRIKEINEAPE